MLISKGNFVSDEIVNKLLKNTILNFKSVKSININQNILRAETATISIISIIGYILSL